MALDPTLSNLAVGSGNALLDTASSFLKNRWSLSGSKKLMALQQQYNRENMSLQNRFLNENQVRQYSNMMRGMLQAGLNPAYDGSAPAAASVPSSSNPSAQFEAAAPNLSDKIAQGFQLSSLSEQIKAQKLKNREQEIKNDSDYLDYLNKSGRYDKFNEDVWRDEEGNILSKDEAKEYLKNNPDKMLQVHKSVGREGALEAEQLLDEFKTQTGERVTRREQATAQQLEASLKSKVIQRQIGSKAVVDALVNMPVQEFNKLVADVRQQGLLSTYQELYNARYESTSATYLIDQIKSPDLNWWEKLIVALTTVLQMFIDK